MAKEEKEKEKEEGEKSGNPMMKIVIIAVLASVLLSGAVVGVTVFLLGGNQAPVTEEVAAEPEEPKLEPPMYQSMDPKFVVSFKDPRQARFMQFSVQVMTRDSKVLDAITLHMPAIRSNLLLLVGNQEHAKVITREGKEQLLLEIKDDINATLESLSETAGVEAAFFNSFVIQ